MSNYTKGEWKVRQVAGHGFKGQVGYAIDYNEDQEQIVDYVYEEADARLIAAAPELLEALERIEMRLDAYNEADRDMPSDSVFVCLETARAAIRKALGEEK